MHFPPERARIQPPGTTATIHLAPFQLQDFETLISWIDTPEALVRWAGPRRFTHPIDVKQLTVQFYETLGLEPRSRMYKALADDGRVVGHIEFGGIDLRDGIATICCVIVAPEERGKHLCLPMVRSALRVGFEKLNFRRIELNVYDINDRAIACYERAGFVREGIQRESVQVGGRVWNTIVMAILRNEWHPDPPMPCNRDV